MGFWPEWGPTAASSERKSERKDVLELLPKKNRFRLEERTTDPNKVLRNVKQKVVIKVNKEKTPPGTPGAGNSAFLNPDRDPKSEAPSKSRNRQRVHF